MATNNPVDVLLAQKLLQHAGEQLGETERNALVAYAGVNEATELWEINMHRHGKHYIESYCKEIDEESKNAFESGVPFAKYGVSIESADAPGKEVDAIAFKVDTADDQFEVFVASFLNTTLPDDAVQLGAVVLSYDVLQEDMRLWLVPQNKCGSTVPTWDKFAPADFLVIDLQMHPAGTARFPFQWTSVVSNVDIRNDPQNTVDLTFRVTRISGPLAEKGSYCTPEGVISPIADPRPVSYGDIFVDTGFMATAEGRGVPGVKKVSFPANMPSETLQWDCLVKSIADDNDVSDLGTKTAILLYDRFAVTPNLPTISFDRPADCPIFFVNFDIRNFLDVDKTRVEVVFDSHMFEILYDAGYYKGVHDDYDTIDGENVSIARLLRYESVVERALMSHTANSATVTKYVTFRAAVVHQGGSMGMPAVGLPLIDLSVRREKNENAIEWVAEGSCPVWQTIAGETRARAWDFDNALPPKTYSCVGVHFSTWALLPTTALAYIRCDALSIKTDFLQACKVAQAVGITEEANQMLPKDLQTLPDARDLVHRLYNDGKSPRAKAMWIPMQILMRGPDTTATATECIAENFIRPTSQWFRVSAIALEHLLRHCNATDQDISGIASRIKEISDGQSVLHLYELKSKSDPSAPPTPLPTSAARQLTVHLATLLLATEVLQDGWVDGGLKFRDRFSRRSAERAVEEACQALISIKI